MSASNSSSGVFDHEAGSTRQTAPIATILIVDDEFPNRKLLEALLKPEGYVTVTAASGEEALASIARRAPDLILLDIVMPGMGGYQMASMLKANPATSDIPIIMVTAHLDPRARLAGLTAGAEEFLTTPVDRTELCLRVRNLLRVKAFGDFLKNHSAVLEQEVQARTADLKRFRAAMEISGDAIALIDRAGMRYIDVNQTLCDLVGRTRQEMLGMTPMDLFSANRELLERDYDKVIADNNYSASKIEGQYCHKDGSLIPIETRRRALHTDDGWIIVSTARDITERKEAENKIRRLNRVYATLSGINTLIVRVHDRDELYREVCRVAVEAGGFRLAWIGIVDRSAMKIVPFASSGENVGFLEEIRERMSLHDGPAGLGPPAIAVRGKQAVVVNDVESDPRIRYKQAHADRGIGSLVILPLLIADEPVAVLGLHAAETGYFDEAEMNLLRELAGDIAFALELMDKSQQLDYLAYYDALTGLANRTLFHERLVQYVSAAQIDKSMLALVLVDIDRFKAVNDSLGRKAGDELIKQVAERVERHAGPVRMARISADLFAIVWSGASSESEVARLIEQWLSECFGPHFLINGADLRVSAKAGIALLPNDGPDADALFRNAEAALKKAKTGGERYLFHTPQMTERIAEKFALENKLRQALEKEEFVLHYQPKVDTATGRIDGVEALIRWQSPELGLVPPMDFIPLLEETGLILEVGAWALRRAVLDHRGWKDRGLLAPRISVNVSAVQLRRRDFVATVEDAIKLGAVPPGIDLEITESLVMEDIEANVEKLRAVRQLGLSIAVDDFGTGYSSLGYLAKLPVQSLKIDRSFIITMLKEPGTMTLVSTIISMAHSLRLTVIAEGVDAEEQAKTLKRLGCDQMQGYLFSKPIPGDQLEKLLARDSQPPSPKAGIRRRQKA